MRKRQGIAASVGLVLVLGIGAWLLTQPRQGSIPVAVKTKSRASTGLDMPPVFKLAQTWTAPAADQFASGSFFFPEIMGSGCALFDYDRDGDLDIYLIHGAGARPPGSAANAPRNRLFRQTGRFQFENVSTGSGLDIAEIGMGIAIGDVNNDGWPDLFLSNYGADRLLLNQHNGKFLDVSRQAGIDDLNWGASACFVDYDRDGWLDLCVSNYLDYDPGRSCADAEGEHDYCNPKLFDGVSARLYRNVSFQDGKQPTATEAKFADVSYESGIGRIKGPGLGVVACDFNGDDWPDLYVANDGAANHLWINQRNGTFQDEAISRGAAYDNQGRPQASMGIALADPDSDGDPDLLLTHLRGENNAFYKNESQYGFSEASSRCGVALASFPFTGFGTAFVDLELDGDLDLVVANGDVRRPRLGMYRRASPLSANDFWQIYAQRNQIFVNDGQGSFSEVRGDQQPFCQNPNVARGLSTGDIDNDGDVDLLVMEANGTCRVFENDAIKKGHWLSLKAIEPKLGGRDAYGAKLTVTAGQQRWTSWVNAAGSYLSASDPRVHFGLGDVTKYASIQITWPNGDQESFPGGSVDRQIETAHGSGAMP